MNELYINNFIENCEALALSKSRIRRYGYYLTWISNQLNKDFKNISKADIQKLLVVIENGKTKKGKPYSEWTKHDLRVSIKKFWRYFRGKDGQDPEETAWFKVTVKANKRKLPESLLTQEDILQLIRASPNAKHKCFISLLYESGARVSELLSVRIKNLEINGEYLKIMLPVSKTQPRTLPLVSSLPYVKEYLNKYHLHSDDPEAFLFYGTKNKYTPLDSNSVRKFLNEAKARCGIRKPANPHAFRHSRASYLCNFLTSFQMNQYFGWSMSSNMPSIYIHLSSRDLDKAILNQVNGLEEVRKEVRDEKLRPKICSKCLEKNEPNLKFCKKCDYPMNVDTVLEREEMIKLSYEYIMGLQTFKGTIQEYNEKFRSKNEIKNI